MTHPRIFPINAIAGGIFALSALVSLRAHTWLDAGIWGALAIAFLVIGDGPELWQAKPGWRKWGAVGFLVAALGLVVAQVISGWQH